MVDIERTEEGINPNIDEKIRRIKQEIFEEMRVPKPRIKNVFVGPRGPNPTNLRGKKIG